MKHPWHLRPAQPSPPIRFLASPYPHSFALGAAPSPSLSFSKRLKILPDGDFGMASVKTMPPVMRLWAEMRGSMKAWMAAAETCLPAGTMWAWGCSSPFLGEGWVLARRVRRDGVGVGTS